MDSDTMKSKNVTKAKLQKITQRLKNDPCTSEFSPKFKHWVKQRGFSLMSYEHLGSKTYCACQQGRRYRHCVLSIS